MDYVGMEVKTWDEFLGTEVISFVKETWKAKYGLAARLVEPYGKMMGPFNLSEFLRDGKTNSQGLHIFSAEMWERNKDEMRAKHENQKFVTLNSEKSESHTEHRKILNLKEAGALSRREIDQAYRKLAKQYHPDTVTGDNALFRKIKVARDVLIDNL